jgi:hypothetical protein
MLEELVAALALQIREVKPLGIDLGRHGYNSAGGCGFDEIQQEVRE